MSPSSSHLSLEIIVIRNWILMNIFSKQKNSGGLGNGDIEGETGVPGKIG